MRDTKIEPKSSDLGVKKHTVTKGRKPRLKLVVK
jgi:hypothetical protein